jgi:transcriptional regulator with XRE-family HTH domain
MALFFDKTWFDAALARCHLQREDLARALGLGDRELAEIWKDQRELSAKEVATMAALLAVGPEEIAHHAGVSTPVPREGGGPRAGTVPGDDFLAQFDARLTRVEHLLEEVRARLQEKRGQ